MDIQIAAFCDFATDNSGKLNLFGVFDTIYTRQLPAAHPYFSVAFRLRFYQTDPLQNHCQLLILDPNGSNIVPETAGNFTNQYPGDAPFIERNILFNLVRITFPTDGKYSAALKINQTLVATIPLIVAVKSAGNPTRTSQTRIWRHKLAAWLTR